MKPATQKVGRITVALGLVAFGVALLLDNLGGVGQATSWVYKLWPIILVGFGAEYLVRTVLSQREEHPTALRFDIGGAILLLLVVALSFGITTVRTWIGTEGGRITFAGGGPAVSRTDTETVALNDAKELQVNVEAGSVRLVQHGSASDIRIDSTYTAYGFIVDNAKVEKELDQIQLNTSNEGGVLKVRANIPVNLNNVGVSYTIYAPAGLKVKADTGAGSIRVTDYKGDLDLQSGAGSITVEAGSGSVNAGSGAGSIAVRNWEGPVTAKAGTGRLEIRNVVGAIQLDSGAGQIMVNEFSGGKLMADTRMGSINVDTSSVLSGDVVLKTSAGSIHLNLPSESSMRASAQTRAGSLSIPGFMSASSNTGPARSGVGTSGDGKHTVTLETGTGSIVFSTR